MNTLLAIFCLLAIALIASAFPSRDSRRPRRDVTFGKHLQPNGGWVNDLQFGNSHFQGQILQGYNRRGQSGPKQYLLGGKYDPNEYYEVFYGLDEIPHYEKRKVRIGGQTHVPVGNGQIGAFAEHSQTMDRNFHRQGETNTAGISLQHNSGASISATGSKTPGQPNTLTVGGNVPLYQSDNVAVGVQASRTHVQGYKPSDQASLQVQGKF